MRKRFILLITLCILLISGCVKQKDSSEVIINTSSSEIIETTSSIEEREEDMKLFIDEQEMDVSWLDNASVKELKNLLPLTIEMSRYGGFEQVGAIGTSIVSNDTQMTTEPGDIVLYNSSNIVIFFGNNSWAYTKLGHINLNKESLTNLLDKPSVTIEITK